VGVRDAVSAQTDISEPIRPAVLLEQEALAIVHLARLAAFALGRVGAVEEGDVLVADIPEPIPQQGIRDSDFQTMSVGATSTYQ